MKVELTPSEIKSQMHNPMNKYDRRILSNLNEVQYFIKELKPRTVLEADTIAKCKIWLAESISLLGVNRYVNGEQTFMFDCQQKIKAEVDEESNSFSKNFNGSGCNTTLK